MLDFSACFSGHLVLRNVHSSSTFDYDTPADPRDVPRDVPRSSAAVAPPRFTALALSAAARRLFYGSGALRSEQARAEQFRRIPHQIFPQTSARRFEHAQTLDLN